MATRQELIDHGYIFGRDFLAGQVLGLISKMRSEGKSDEVIIRTLRKSLSKLTVFLEE